MKNLFKRADIYSIIYSKKNYKKEVSFILNKFRKYNIRAKTILELGSGMGGHAKYLCKKNIKVTGVDKSKSMINQSIKDKNFINVLGDIKKINLKKKFDVAISMFHVLSYQILNNDVRKTFLTANKHLDKGSFFFFDFWYTPAVKYLKPVNKYNIYKSKNIVIKKYVNVKNIIKTNSVKVNYTFKIKEKNFQKEKQFKEVHQMRHFSLREIKQFSKISGFKFCESCELVTNRKINKKTWGAFVVLKKIKSIK